MANAGILPEWRYAQTVLPFVRDTTHESYDSQAREMFLAKLFNEGHMPSAITQEDLANVQGLIQKLEAIASRG